jgi:multidrug efflux system membrane fusion protein
VAVAQKTASGATIERKGRLLRLLRDLDPRGRMARLIVQIDDPMELAKEVDARRLPLLTGAFVSVKLQGTVLEDVVAVPREALRDGRYVWVLTEDKRLAIREVQVVWRERSRVLISQGLTEGEHVILSPLGAPVAGMALRSETASPSEAGSADPEAASEGAANARVEEGDTGADEPGDEDEDDGEEETP